MSLFDDSALGGQVKVNRGPACGVCKLKESCKSPEMGLQGQGERGILIVLPGPTRMDDHRGKYVEKLRIIGPVLSKYGIDINRDCWVTGASICYASGGATVAHAQHCRYNLLQNIEQLDPKVCILVGDPACAGLIQHDYVGNCDPRAELWAGEVIPSQQLNTWIVPVPDTPRWEYPGENHIVDNSLRKVSEVCDGRPWISGCHYADNIEAVFDEDRACDLINYMVSQGKPVAFDYETNTLRPETEGAKIYSVGFSDGERTFAVPFYPKVREATGLFLSSGVPKIAANMKFEERWSVNIFGQPVNNWAWDTMLAAHWLQCRSGITGLKFQSYAKLGQPQYNTAVEPYFHSEAWELNKINMVDPEALLRYNAMDCILELLLAQVQWKAANHSFCTDNYDHLLPRIY